VTDSKSPGTLALRVTAEPGFSAIIDGRPLALSSYDDVMFQVAVPVGKHIITLTYLPARLELGVIAALIALIGMVLAGILGLRSRRRARDDSRERAYDGLACS
jgi:uncharacterized membrane protein YfhO